MRNAIANDELPALPRGATRRSVLGFLAAVAASPMAASRALATRSSWRRAAASLEFRTLGSPQPRYLHAAVAVGDGRVVVIGGYANSDAARGRTPSAPNSSVQLYDPESDAWADLAPLNMPRARHAAVLLPGGRIAVMGGYFASALNSVEIYDPRMDQWHEGDPLPIPMFDHAASLCGEFIVLTGGQDGLPAVLIPTPMPNMAQP